MNVSRDLLSKDLCASSLLAGWEHGQKKPSKMLRNTLLSRLGIPTQEKDHLVSVIEYKRWKERTRILHYIAYEQYDQAIMELRAFKNGDTLEKALEDQFYYACVAEIRDRRGAKKSDVRALYEKALHITVPDYAKENWKELCLSEVEINLLMDVESRKEQPNIETYYAIIDYTCRRGYRLEQSVKVVPKVIVYLCRSVKLEEIEDANLFEIFSLTERALEMLIKKQCSFFLWELLVERESVLKEILRRFGCHDFRGPVDYKKVLTDNQKLRLAIQKLCDQFQISYYSRSVSFLFLEKNVICINDVIRIRRHMLGITSEVLSNGLCHIRSYRRIERGDTLPQRNVVEELLTRVGLDKKYSAGNYEYIQEVEGLNLQSRKALELMEKLKNGEITQEKCALQIKGVLELTLSYDALFRGGEQYFTQSELFCIQCLLLISDEKNEKYLLLLKKCKSYFDNYFLQGLQASVASKHESFFKIVRKELEKQGEVECANEISRFLIEASIRNHSFAQLPGFS